MNNNTKDSGLDPDIAELLGLPADSGQQSTAPQQQQQQKQQPPQQQPQPAAPAGGNDPGSMDLSEDDGIADYSDGVPHTDADDLDIFLEDDEPQPSEEEPEKKDEAGKGQQDAQAADVPVTPDQLKTPDQEELKKQEETPKKPKVDEKKYKMPGNTSNFPYKKSIEFVEKGYVVRAVDGEDPAYIKPLAKMKKMFDDPPDKKDKFLYRQKMASAYWNLLGEVAKKIGKRLPIEKKLMLRFGLFDSKYLKPSQIEMIKSIPLKKKLEEPIFYMDEWLRKIAEGAVKQSLVDETKKKKTPVAREAEKLERKYGSRDAELANLKSKLDQLDMEEEALKGAVNIVCDREEHPTYEEIKFGYSSAQKESINQVQAACRKLNLLNKDIEAQFRALDRLESEIADLKGQLPDEDEDEQEIEIDVDTVKEEFSSLRQMVKLCVGRQGNHFPVLYAPYFVDDVKLMATRENVLEEIKLVEKFDPGLFVRRYKREEHRIFPYLLILPGYGENGICWEPYDKYNKASSRGRIAICAFPKSVRQAVISALADLRWQVAKEIAGHRWMEEGLTGKYYEYYMENKLRGDIKMHFINDYILWITMESQGMQKLHRDSRPVFWRYTPFPQELKEVLKNRGYFYNELYKKDVNIARSDGY